jgi:hypothetical protein
MNQIYSLIFPVIIFFQAEKDCDLVFECKATSSEKSAAYSLQIKLKEGDPGEYTFDLYDLNLGKTVKTEDSFFSEGDTKVIFTDVKPSTYTVVFYGSNCKTKKAIQGKGITLL